MNRRLLWKLLLIIATGTVALFYVINILTSRAEEGMSFLAQEDRAQITAWGREAEQIYLTGDETALSNWLIQLQQQENTWVAVIRSDLTPIAGSQLNQRFYDEFSIGRSVDWMIHLYFVENPVMEVTFNDRRIHFLILLPQRMRPGLYWAYAHIALQIILPMLLLAVLSLVLYQHIMNPLRELERATRAFSRGQLDVRVRQLLGNRSDELTELATTFDQMASRIGELIVNQRQLIADLSHELRTPLTRLDIALDNLQEDRSDANIERIQRESLHIRRLVEDTLALAWLENERPNLHSESLDLVDLLDVLCEDAQFEFTDRTLHRQLPDTAEIHNTSHRALGQALENIIRNALRYTGSNKHVWVELISTATSYIIQVKDQGPGVPDAFLERIFEPFFRLDTARSLSSPVSASGTASDSAIVTTSGFGLGLALARRQLHAVGGSVSAMNLAQGGLQMTVVLPR